MNQAKEIKKHILANLKKHPQDIVAVTAEHFNVSRTTIHRHINSLVKSDKVSKHGTTRQAVYYLNDENNISLKFKLTNDLDEFDVYQQHFGKLFKTLPKNIDSICDYVMTKLINNAKDHSQGNWLRISLHWHSHGFMIEIIDNGIGIFENMYQKLHLDDKREAILHISKGKITTDPINHTGEGLFFTARAVNKMTIKANNLIFIRDNRINDWGISSNAKEKGTTILLEIDNDTDSDLVKLFQRYQEEEDLAFVKTDIIVELSKFEWETMMSRSQAKRILKGLEKFTKVTLDFKGVKFVGQGFADEIFRVFKIKQPHISFTTINANDDVTFMIERAVRTPR